MANASHLIETIGSDHYVTADEVIMLRRTIFADGIVSRNELDALFDLAARAPDGDPQWPSYFCEAAADFYLREEEPAGYLTEQEFEGLKQQVLADMRVSGFEVRFLITLMEKAVSTPPQMHDFIRSVFVKVVTARTPPVMHADDVRLIKRLIFASGGDGNVAVTRDEAEFLFALNDAVIDQDNDPSWDQLLKLAITNHLMAHIGYTPLERSEAIALYTDDPTDGGPAPTKRHQDESAIDATRRVFRDMMGNIFTPLRAHRARVEQRYRILNDERAAGAEEAEQVTETEADWLLDRFARDKKLHDTEVAILRHMAETMGAGLPHRLKQILDKAG